jgi:hypothetical protein
MRDARGAWKDARSRYPRRLGAISSSPAAAHDFRQPGTPVKERHAFPRFFHDTWAEPGEAAVGHDAGSFCARRRQTARA